MLRVTVIEKKYLKKLLINIENKKIKELMKKKL